jgi:hypothetical protein
VAARTAAFLGHRVLEVEMTAARSAICRVRHGSMRAQLLCRRTLDEEVVGETTAYLHGRLSEACHHPYEHGPTVAEAQGLIEQVVTVADQISSQRTPRWPDASPVQLGPASTFHSAQRAA